MSAVLSCLGEPGRLLQSAYCLVELRYGGDIYHGGCLVMPR